MAQQLKFICKIISRAKTLVKWVPSSLFPIAYVLKPETTHTHTYIRTHRHAHTHTHKHIHKHPHTRTHTHTHTRIFSHHRRHKQVEVSSLISQNMNRARISLYIWISKTGLQEKKQLIRSLPLPTPLCLCIWLHTMLFFSSAWALFTKVQKKTILEHKLIKLILINFNRNCVQKLDFSLTVVVKVC